MDVNIKVPYVFRVSVSEYILSRSDRIKPSTPVHLHLFENSLQVSAGSSRINREALEINRLLVHVVSSNTNYLDSLFLPVSPMKGAWQSE